MALCNLLVPWISFLWVLFLVITLLGVTFGYLDAGLQGVILKIWGPSASRPLIYLYHFTVGVGGFVAPFIAEPFLAMEYGEVGVDPECLRSDSNGVKQSSANQSNYTTTQLATTTFAKKFNPVGWTYIIIGAYFVVATMATIMLACLKADRKSFSSFDQSRAVKVEKRAEEPLCDVIYVFIPVLGYFFCGVGNEILFSSFIYSVSVCSDLRFSISQAAQINSLYWVGFFLGRGLGIFAASYVKPRSISVISIAGTIVMMVLMVTLGQSFHAVSWIVSVGHGFFVGPLYPSGVTWLSQVTNVSGKYMTIFILGGTLGCVVALPLGGLLFQSSPFNVMYLACALSCANALCFAGAIWANKRHKKLRYVNADACLRGTDDET
ncbi:sodium-dependent glucose transporter 1C-like isoform X2 [Clavelina lepadiformis]|uniref:Uncharacterized protein n=1 Tax=Clavelina lepadiformis TaxID=159417 RepID=A0ABP0FWM8_CLALP